MPFVEIASGIPGLIRMDLQAGSETHWNLILIFDSHLDEAQIRPLENFSRLAGHVVSFSPKEKVESYEDLFLHILSQSRKFKEVVMVINGHFAPYAIFHYSSLEHVKKIVFINPVFNGEIATIMSRFEIPTLVITGTPGNLDHNVDAVKYHDLMANSRIQYVRGVEGNPLFMKFTQSFNAISHFLADE